MVLQMSPPNYALFAGKAGREAVTKVTTRLETRRIVQRNSRDEKEFIE